MKAVVSGSEDQQGVTMHYGIALPNGGVCGDPHTLASLATLAEETGWDGIFLEDYIVWQGHQDVPTYDPWISLAAMAVHHSSIPF